MLLKKRPMTCLMLPYTCAIPHVPLLWYMIINGGITTISVKTLTHIIHREDPNNSLPAKTTEHV